ncbi:MAG: amidase [Anaerolineae bacterium]|jgi:Asp-tRNA(Asn)/Glu-tRNA(Gln) amidotransferase A subunit family amidase
MTPPLLNPAPLAESVVQLRSGQLDLHTAIDAACDRMDQVDPLVQALLPEPDRRGRLHRAAQELLAAYPEPASRPPLFGVLLAVKDIFRVDGFPTAAGSALPPEAFVGPEAASVARLRQAGALVLGKAVTTEFAYFEPGPTRNPHALDHTPGGSSSGSAAAVAAGLAPLALGTQTIGSIIRPAAFCGVIGFKPSLGRIDSQGLIFFSPTLDQVGLFTQDLAGMALAAAVLCSDWQEQPAPHRPPVLGVPIGSYLEQAESAALRAFWQQLAKLAAAGAEVRQTPALANVAALNALHRRLVFAEFAQQHAALYPPYANLYRPRTVEIIQMGNQVSPEELAAARANIGMLRSQLQETMDTAGIDLWVCPAACGAAPAGLQATGDPAMNLPWTHAGLPALTLPAGRAENGLPLGLQLVGRFGQDEALISWALRIAATEGGAFSGAP